MTVTEMRCAAVSIGALACGVLDIVISNITQASGIWAALGLTAFCALTATIAASMVLGQIAALKPGGVIQVPVPHVPGCRYARFSELPGLILVMLAGAEHRDRARRILARRAAVSAHTGSPVSAARRPVLSSARRRIMRTLRTSRGRLPRVDWNSRNELRSTGLNRVMMRVNTSLAVSSWVVYPWFAARDWTLLFAPLIVTIPVTLQWITARKIYGIRQPGPALSDHPDFREGSKS